MMLTTFDKAIIPFLASLVAWLNQHYGWHLPNDDGSLTVLIGAVTSIIVYFIPNKGTA